MVEIIQISTQGKQGFHDITEKVQAVVHGARVQDGICFVFCPHTTAGITLNENWDSSVQHDLGVGLAKISPSRPEYRHSEGNSPAHLKSSIVGAGQFVPVEGGRLVLGRWQGIFLAEFDGPRTRRIHVQVIGG
jgi:secondary thiamine-phosphate synthase enzyme